MSQLMLTRRPKPNEDTVTITVPPSDVARLVEVVAVNCDRGKTRLQFRADRDILILRGELEPRPAA